MDQAAILTRDTTKSLVVSRAYNFALSPHNTVPGAAKQAYTEGLLSERPKWQPRPWKRKFTEPFISQRYEAQLKASLALGNSLGVFLFCFVLPVAEVQELLQNF